MSRQVNMHLTDEEYARLKRIADRQDKAPGSVAKVLMLARLETVELIASEAPKADAAQ